MDRLDPARQAWMRRVPLEFGVPAARDAGPRMQLAQRANQRVGVVGERERVQVARRFVRLPLLRAERHHRKQHDRPHGLRGQRTWDGRRTIGDKRAWRRSACRRDARHPRRRGFSADLCASSWASTAVASSWPRSTRVLVRRRPTAAVTGARRVGVPPPAVDRFSRTAAAAVLSCG